MNAGDVAGFGNFINTVGSNNVIASAFDSSNSSIVGNGNTVGSTATSTGAVVHGNNNTVNATNAIAVGNSTTVTGANSAAIGQGSSATAPNAVALGAGSVADQANTISVGSVGNERRITNVAAGINGTDAVNVDQLNQTVDDAIDGFEDKAESGGAGAMAAAALRYDDRPGKFSLAAGGSYFLDTGALAVGAGFTSQSQRVRVNAAGAFVPEHEEVGVSAGVSFTLN